MHIQVNAAPPPIALPPTSPPLAASTTPPPPLDLAPHWKAIIKIIVLFVVPFWDLYTFSSIIAHMAQDCAQTVLADNHTYLRTCFIVWVIMNVIVDYSKMAYAIKGIKNNRTKQLLNIYDSFRTYLSQNNVDMDRSCDTRATSLLLLDVFVIELPLLLFTVDLRSYTKSLTTIPLLITLKAIIFMSKDISFELIYRALKRRKNAFRNGVNRVIVVAIFCVILLLAVSWISEQKITAKSGQNIVRFKASSGSILYENQPGQAVTCTQNEHPVSNVLLIPQNSDVVCTTVDGAYDIKLGLSYTDKSLEAEMTAYSEQIAKGAFDMVGLGPFFPQTVKVQNAGSDPFSFTFVLDQYEQCKI